MFNSSKLSDSRYLNTSRSNSIDETLNETNKTFLHPKITSTPLNSIFATPPKNPIMTPRRYSLSEIATPPRNTRREYIRSKSSQYMPGPLLSSIKFNLNVSTFEDAKSPGLVNRIVQYHEETDRPREQNRPPTHQTKYGTVGLFPVVHLFKNKLPVLDKKPRHVTIRVAGSDYIRHTPEYNKKLLEGIVRPNGSLSHPGHSETPTNTRSVLDALKEISRKRIHANEELELHEDAGKRLRTDNEEITDSSKRQRDESPTLDTSTSPIKPASKKVCMYDEYTASRSSMDFSFRRVDSPLPKRKSISISTLTENIKESKQVKHINAETQTTEENSKKVDDGKSSDEEDSESDTSTKTTTAVKVFNDAPLSRIRKNRLAALMGTLIGKDPVLDPKPDYETQISDKTDDSQMEKYFENEKVFDKTEKPLVSILSVHKSPNKSDKHVTFDIPESISHSSITKIEESTTTPISVNRIENNEKDSSNIPNLLVTNIDVVKPSFSFGSSVTKSLTLPISSTSVASPDKFIQKSITQDVSKSIPSFNFGKIISSSNIVTTTSPKIGGFKFDLTKPTSITSSLTQSTSSILPNTTTVTLPSSSLAITTSVTIFNSPIVSTTVSPNTKGDISTTRPIFGDTIPAISSPFGSSALVPSPISSKPSYSFGPPTVTSTATGGNLMFGKSSSEPANSIGSFNPLKFGAPSSNVGGFSPSATSTNSFSTLTSVANKDLITTPSVVTSSFGTPMVPFCSGNFTGVGNFQSPVKSNSSMTFAVTTTPNAVSFGTPSTTTPNAVSFGTPSTTPNAISFGTPSTTTPNAISFGTPSTTTPNAISFGTPSTAANFNNNFAFGAKTTPNFASTAVPAFGTTTAGDNGTAKASVFGSTTTPSFGPNTTPSFGNTTNSGFGISSGGFINTTTTSSGFGLPVTTTSNIFGTPTTTTGFGNNFAPSPFAVVTTNVTSGFGTSTTSISGFGPSNPNPTNFGSSAPGFNFGASSTTANTGFGISATTTTGFGTTTVPTFTPNQSSIFASSNVPSFGHTGTSSFGSSTGSGSFSETPFGASASATPAFPITTNTTNTSSFNYGDPKKMFSGVNTPFGTPTTTTSNALFSSSTQSPFGNNAPTTSAAHPFAFAAKTTNSSFPSTNTVTPSFGTAFRQTNTGFNTPPTGFGTTTKTPTFGNTTPAFGAAATTQAFGTTQPQVQQFGSADSAFNKTQTSPPNAFGASQFNFNPQQNAPTNQASIFTFGSGPSEKQAFNFGAKSTEPPKKFDFTGANNPPPAFGAAFGNAAPPPAFGNAAPPPAFGTAPPTGSFSIGTGSTTSRHRPQVKAKRRT